jgi:UDP-glucose 6-dehydrogenase
MDRLSVAIIGNGVVGQATKRVIDKYHSVQMHDPLQNLVCDYELSDVVFICTPSECVKEYLAKLEGHPFVYVRSTIPFHLVQDTNFAVWPEFLTERTAVHDSLNPTHNVVGGNAQQVDKLCETTIFNEFDVTTNIYAALMKLTTNVYFAQKVSFANVMYNLCQEQNLDYNELKRILGSDPRTWIKDHWTVPGPDGKFGYGGKCLPANVDIMLELVTGKDKDLIEKYKQYNEEQRDEDSNNRSGRIYRIQPSKKTS